MTLTEQRSDEKPGQHHLCLHARFAIPSAMIDKQSAGETLCEQVLRSLLMRQQTVVPQRCAGSSHVVLCMFVVSTLSLFSLMPTEAHGPILIT